MTRLNRGLRNAIFTIVGIGGLLIACAPVRFSSSPTPPASEAGCGTGGRTCSPGDGSYHVNESFQAPTSSADVLFVVDNSASMSPIQSSIASRFSTFVSTLGALDYRIAITTTDWINDAGRLLTFGNGSQVLAPNPGIDVQGLFGATIQRPETRTCESYLASHDCHYAANCTDYASYCRTEDTRAILASELAIQNGQSGFPRENVPLSIVIVSNADERAAGGRVSGTYPLQNVDYPNYLTSMFANHYGSSKSLTVHSIIIQTGDQGCLNAQRQSDLVFGWTGDMYQNLSYATGGRVGSVCAGDYSSQLGQIAGTVANSPASHDLACAPVTGSFQISISPADGSANPQLNGSRVQFAHPLSPSTSVTVSYDCPST